jgi:hypothetical protein
MLIKLVTLGYCKIIWWYVRVRLTFMKEKYLFEGIEEPREIYYLSVLPLVPTAFAVVSGCYIFSSCCDKDSAIIFTTSRQPDVNPS